MLHGGGGHGHSGGHSGSHGHGHGGHHHVMQGSHPDQLPNWNMAMQADKGWAHIFKKIDRRPFMIVFFMFFGAFVWLYIIYLVHHKDAVRDHTAFIDFSRNQSAVNNDNRLGAMEAAQNASVAHRGAASFSPSVFGAPRADAYAGSAENSLQSSNSQSANSQSGPPQTAFAQAVAQSATSSLQSQYGAAATSAANPFGSAVSTGGNIRALVPNTFTSTTALVAPRNLRHAVGAPLDYSAMPNGRQRTLITR